MKITLGEIIGGIDNEGKSIGLDNLQNLLKSKLPVKIAYKLNKLYQNIINELKSYNETKDSIVLDLAKDLPDPTKITSENPELLAEFNKRHNELLGMEVEIDFEKISVDELGDLIVSPNELISWIFKD